MELTLKRIEEKRPCASGWKTLLKSLDKTKADDEKLDLMHILKSNGIQDAIWCLRCFDYLDYCLFLADVTESVLHIYERDNKSTAPRDAIEAIREYKLGNITKEKLSAAAAAAAYDAAYAAAYAAAYDAAAAAAYAAAYDAAAAAAYAAYAAAAAYDATYDAAAAADGDKKWKEIEALFVKHFGA